MKHFAMYSLMRILLFAGVLFALYAVGARDVLLVVLSLLISAALSYLLLRQQRDRVAGVISNRIDKKQATRFEQGVEDANAAEDAAADRQSN